MQEKRLNTGYILSQCLPLWRLPQLTANFHSIRCCPKPQTHQLPANPLHNEHSGQAEHFRRTAPCVRHFRQPQTSDRAGQSPLISSQVVLHFAFSTTTRLVHTTPQNVTDLSELASSVNDSNITGHKTIKKEIDDTHRHHVRDTVPLNNHTQVKQSTVTSDLQRASRSRLLTTLAASQCCMNTCVHT